MPKRPDIFKMLDVERKTFLGLPGNALKVWLFYWMKEGKERLAWSTEKGALEVLQMNRKTFYAARKWLVAHGWLKEVIKRGRYHGEYSTAVFRVKEGTIPESNDKRKGNDPSKARKTKKMRAEKRRLGLEAVAEFAVPAEESESQNLGLDVPKNGTGSQSQNLERNASQNSVREPSQNLREEVYTGEVDTVEVEPDVSQSVSQSYATSLLPQGKTTTDVVLNREDPNWQEAYATLTESDNYTIPFPKLFAIGITPVYLTTAERIASSLAKRNRNSYWLEELIRWVRTGKGREPNFWKSRLHSGERGWKQLAKFLETGELPTQFEAQHAVSSHNPTWEAWLLHPEEQGEVEVFDEEEA